MSTDQQIEQEIQAKGLTAPRVTLDALNENIVSVEIVKHINARSELWPLMGYELRCRLAQGKE